MIYKMAKGNDRLDLINSDIEFMENRIDCLSVNRYYKIDNDLTIYFKMASPNEFGLAKLKQSKQTKGQKTMDLKAKLQAKKQLAKGNDIAINNNASKGQKTMDLKAKFKNQSAMNKAELNINKFAEVSELRETIKQQSIDIVNLQSDIKDLSKVLFENNNLLAIIAKDLQSNLKAFNGLHPKIDSLIKGNAIASPAIKTMASPEVKTIKAKDKAIASPAMVSIESQGLDQDSYQGLYEHFKAYFNHKFAKSSKADQLPEFIFFINGIDFASPDTIDQSARAIWQEYRANNNAMIFAPNSMKLAIDSLIKLGNDFDLMASPDMANSQVNSEVIDFAFFSKLLALDISYIKEIASLLKSEGYNEMTKGLIIDHIKDNAKQENKASDIEGFIDWIKIADNRNNG